MGYRLVNPSNEYLSRTSGFPNYNNNYTFMFWVLIVGDENGRRGWFTMNDGTAANLDFLGNGTDGTSLEISGRIGGEGVLNTGTDLNLGQWYHVTMVRSATNALEAFLDGVSDVTQTQEISGRAAASENVIGKLAAASSGNLVADIRFCAVKIWTTDLSTKEINNEMNSIVPIKWANIHTWSPLTKIGDAIDYSGNGNDWTENGTPITEDTAPVSWRHGRRNVNPNPAPAPVAFAHVPIAQVTAA